MTVTQSAHDVRPPAAAGTFYPADPTRLTRLIDDYLAQATRLEPEPSIVIVPHAGYEYSGPVAAHGFKQIIDRPYERVIVLGFNHHYSYGFDGAAVWPAGAWRTPLGEVTIDEAFVQRLLAAGPVFKPDRSIHLGEHSLEVEVPFIQRVLPGVPIVPISIGRPTLENAQAIAAGLAQVLHDTMGTLVVTSTDLSHYPPYQEAVQIDQTTIKTILSLDPRDLEEWSEKALSAHIPDLATVMCGSGPVMVAMLLARHIGAVQVTLLHYANSGDVPSGSQGSVVGYAAIEFVQPTTLSAEDKSVLLKLARDTLDQYLSEHRLPAFTPASAIMQQPRATFVTLRQKQSHELRGCRGEVMAQYPLWESVQQVSVLSATDDPRFRPVRHAELAGLQIEISVLTPMRLARDPSEVVVGKHGVMIRQGLRGGLFLPQVPVEQGWDHDEYLSNLCAMKAGLPADAWRKKDVQLYIFEAEIFEE